MGGGDRVDRVDWVGGTKKRDGHTDRQTSYSIIILDTN